MDENTALVAAIEAERAAQGMTLEELARATGVSYSSMQRYLAGERVIRSDLMWKFGRVLSVPTSALWTDAERRLRQAESQRSAVSAVTHSGAGDDDSPQVSGDVAAQLGEQVTALRALVESLGGTIQTKPRVQKPAPTSLKGDADDPPTTGRPHAI